MSFHLKTASGWHITSPNTTIGCTAVTFSNADFCCTVVRGGAHDETEWYPILLDCLLAIKELDEDIESLFLALIPTYRKEAGKAFLQAMVIRKLQGELPWHHVYPWRARLEDLQEVANQLRGR